MVSETTPAVIQTESVAPDTGNNDGSKVVVKQIEKTNVGISLFMPFNFDVNLREDTNDLVNQVLTIGSVPWINFYEGAKMAADSFSNDKVQLKIDVFDSAIDSGLIATMVNGKKIYNNKILISAAPAWCNASLSRQSELNHVSLVFPQSGNSILNDALYLTPTNAIMIDEMCKWISYTHSNDKVTIVYRDNAREKDLSKSFSVKIDSLSQNKIKTNLINYTNSKIDGLIRALDKQNNNLVIITSSDEAFVSPTVNKLCEQLNQYKITLCGLPTWENFETIDLDNLQKLNTHVFSATWINNSNEDFSNFRKTFVERFYAEPAFSSYQGFYFVKGLIQSIDKNRFVELKNIDVSNSYFDHDLFIFEKQENKGNGVMNKSVQILKHEDYNLIKVN